MLPRRSRSLSYCSLLVGPGWFTYIYRHFYREKARPPLDIDRLKRPQRLCRRHHLYKYSLYWTTQRYKMSGRIFTSRSIPILTATTLSVSLYALHTHVRPILLDAAPVESTFGLPKKPRLAITPTTSPYVPMGWGSNRYLTLIPDKAVGQLKKPAALPQFGATPLRDLVLAEQYGAALDGKGDCWMWGTGYDESGQIGRSLKGKVSNISSQKLMIEPQNNYTCQIEIILPEQIRSSIRIISFQIHSIII